MGPGILPETTVGKHNPPCHLQMPTKALSCKRKPYVNMVQKRHCVLWAKDHLKWTFKVEKCSMVRRVQFDILVGNHGRRVLRAKEQGDLPACYQCSVQTPASLIVWGCISAYGMGSWKSISGKNTTEFHTKTPRPGCMKALKLRNP